MGVQPIAATQASCKTVVDKESPWEINSETFFKRNNQLRALVSELLGVSSEQVALIPSVSYGVETAVKCLQVQKNVLVPQNDFPSNIYPWMEYAKENNLQVKFVEKSPDQTWTDAFLQAIDSSVGLVSVPQCDWSTGELFDLEKISQKTKKVSAYLVVDVSQSFGGRAIDVSSFEPDFLLSVGYKWQLGPYGLSYLYADKKHLNKPPLENNWINRSNSENFAQLTEYTPNYHIGAKRFDSGGRNHFGVSGAIESFKILKQTGLQNIYAHILALNEKLVELLKKNDFKIIGPSEGRHMLSVSLKGLDGQQVIEKLAAEKCYVSRRGDSLRLSPHLYNTLDDIEHFVSVISSLN